MRKTLFAAAVMLFSSGSFADSNDLLGSVLGPNEQPVHGATVYVYTARVKEGTNPLCPSCYADCAKSEKTDAAGRFAIASLDPKLRFKILIVATGFSPQFVENVDPAEGEMAATLQFIPEERLAPKFGVRGRIVGPDGLPVAGATVEFLQISVPALERKTNEAMQELLPAKDGEEFRRLMYERMIAYSPDREKIDALAVTNEEGEFLLTSEYADASYDVMVRARGLAPEKITGLRAGKIVHERKLDYGVTAAGFIEGNDLALAQVLVGIVQINRRDPFYGDYVVGVNGDGYFEIPNLPPLRDYYVYGKMESLQGIGVVPAQTFRTGKHDSRVNLGILDIDPGLKVSGRVILSDGSPFPPKTHLMFSRQNAWDTRTSIIDEDGFFSASDLPPGPYTISLRIPGYRMSDRNYSLDPLNLYLLSGVIEEDVSGLEILMELGDLEHGMPTYNEAMVERRRRLKSEPIQGYDSD